MNFYELESEINSEFNSQVTEKSDLLFCNKIEFSSQSSNENLNNISSILDSSDLNSNNCENDFESDSKESYKYTLSNYSFNKLKKSKSIQKIDINSNNNNCVYSLSNSNSFIYEKEFLLQKGDWSSSSSVSENFDLKEINVKNIFREFFSSSSDFDSSDFEYEDNKKILPSISHIESNNLNYLAENIAESISKIFINSPNEDLRIKALNVSGASSCNELNEKITSQISNFLQLDENKKVEKPHVINKNKRCKRKLVKERLHLKK